MDPNDEVRVLKLHASYPQGAEKVLVQAATGRKVPAGGLQMCIRDRLKLFQKLVSFQR